MATTFNTREDLENELVSNPLSQWFKTTVIETDITMKTWFSIEYFRARIGVGNSTVLEYIRGENTIIYPMEEIDIVFPITLKQSGSGSPNFYPCRAIYTHNGVLYGYQGYSDINEIRKFHFSNISHNDSNWKEIHHQYIPEYMKKAYHDQYEVWTKPNKKEFNGRRPIEEFDKTIWYTESPAFFTSDGDGNKIWYTLSELEDNLDNINRYAVYDHYPERSDSETYAYKEIDGEPVTPKDFSIVYGTEQE